MRLTTLIFIAAIVQVSAVSKAQKVTLSEKNAPLVAVFDKIRNQTGYDFVVTKEVLKQAGPVTIHVKNEALTTVLGQLLKGQHLNFSIDDKIVVISKKEKTVMDKVVDYLNSVTVSGRVINERNEPLSGANVVVMDKGLGYQADESGHFSINGLSGDETLITSYLGYKTDTLKLHGQKNVTIRMVQLVAALEVININVVNTGYQQLNKERATGSFSKPDMKVFSNRTGTMDLMGRLDGLVPGLTVSQDNLLDVMTGVSSRRALIRGASSVKLLPDPLYVVNGVIVSNFSAVNIDDVDDITVLKDAAAAAIWGAKAANGVVVITTKSGKKNQEIKISYQGFANFQGKPDLNYQRNLSSSQYIQAAREIFDPVAYPYSALTYSLIAPHDQFLYDLQSSDPLISSRASAGLDSLSRIDNRQQILDLWYRNAYTINHTLSASGGGNSYSFYSSLGYTDTHSSVIGEKNNTYRIDFNQTFTPNERFSFSLNTWLANTVSSGKHGIGIGADAIPYQQFKDANGNNLNLPYVWGMSPALRADYQAQSGIDLGSYSPLEELDYGHTGSNSLSINAVANATVKLWKGLSYQGTYGYMTSPAENTRYDDHRQYEARLQLLSFTKAGENGAAPEYLLPTTGGTYRTTNITQRSWVLRNQLVYTYSGHNGDHLLSLQAGQEAREDFSRNAATTLLGYDEDLQTYPLLDNLTLSQGVPGTVTGYGFINMQPYQVTENTSRYTSYFGLASFTLGHKYSIDASWRRDHSNLFGSDVSAQNKPVYSIGAKWNLGNENFLKPVTWLDNLALRVTYGITGNSPYVGAASSQDVLYDPGQYSSFPVLPGGSYDLSSLANRKLSWEAAHTINVGVDFGVWKGRLGGSLEYYHKNTTDLIGSVRLDPFTGSTSATSNIGNLTNSGINIGLNSVNIRSRNFNWSSALVFAMNTNKLVSFSAPGSYENTASARFFTNYVLGYSLSPLFAYQYAGLDPVGDPLIRLADGTVTKDPQKPEGKDLVYKGSIVPKYNGGITNTFNYKQFELSANMVYSLGAVMRRDVNTFYSGRLTGNQGFGGNISADFLNRWKKPGDEQFTDIPAYTSDSEYNYTNRNTDFYVRSDVNVVSASYLKLRDISLAYHLDPRLLNWLKVGSASLRLQVSNILLWKANKYGIDPEFQNYQNGTRGLPVAQHAVTIGANINF